MAILEKLKIYYAPVPKVSCTSIKTMLYEAEHGEPFEVARARDGLDHIHTIYETQPPRDVPQERIAGFDRIAVVRDPLARFVSAFRNRVGHHRELSAKKAGPQLAAFDLAPDPDLPHFISQFDKYREAVSSIDHHFAPMTEFLDRDPEYFTRIYRMDELDELRQFVSERAGRPLTLGRYQTGGFKMDVSDLTWLQRRKIRRMYRDDYRIFARYL